MEIQHTLQATPEQVKRAEAARSPVSYLAEEKFESLKGRLVALLLDGSDKGTVIATAPLDFEDPSKPRKTIRDQVEKSEYKDRLYQVRQVLDASTEERSRA